MHRLCGLRMCRRFMAWIRLWIHQSICVITCFVNLQFFTKHQTRSGTLVCLWIFCLAPSRLSAALPVHRNSVNLVACFGQSHRGGVSQSETECSTLLEFMTNIRERRGERRWLIPPMNSISNYTLKVIKSTLQISDYCVFTCVAFSSDLLWNKTHF